MFAKLESLSRRYDELNDRLATGLTTSAETQKFGKELAQLRDLVMTFRRYTVAKTELQDLKQLLETESDAELRTLAKDDVSRLEVEILELEQALKILLLPKDPNDERNILLEIRAGTGGDEAALFVADLFRMYVRYAEAHGWTCEIVSDNATGKGGYKEIIAEISGASVYSRLKFESGTHRVQRVPQTEASGRIHTSAVTVAVMPEADEVEVNLPETDLKIDVMRAGGAGGQHVNKTESAVRITHIPTGLVVLCRDERSQHKNRARAMQVLRTRLLEMRQNEQNQSQADERRQQVGSGDRSEKIRTYNFPQSRVTDHRINLTVHDLSGILDGKLDQIIDPLLAHFQALALQQVQTA